MSNINQLSSTDKLSSGDQLAVWITGNGGTYRASLSQLLDFIQSNASSASGFDTQYSAPSATGFSVSVSAGETGKDNAWLVLTPVAGYAAGTIVLPAAAGSTHHGQEVNVNCTQSVTALTVDGNGATVTGAPTTLAANDFFRLRFDGVTNTWYRVG